VSFFTLGCFLIWVVSLFDRLLIMNIILWLITCVFLTLVLAVMFRFLMTLILDHFAEGQLGVKIILLCDGWLSAAEMWLKHVEVRLRSVRTCSKSGDHWERVQERLTSTFLKRGTFMVLNLNGCCLLQWISTSLARDAHNALSLKADRCQELFIQRLTMN